MKPIWGIHNNRPELDLVSDGFVSIGWEEIGDIREVGPDREALKARLAETYPDAKPGAIPPWAGVLLRFAFEMQVGDFVIYPYKPDSTLNFGRIAGEYYWGPDAPHRSRRKVEWLRTDVPRTQFSKSARYEIGSAVTLFRVKNNAEEFAAFLAGEQPTKDAGGRSAAARCCGGSPGRAECRADP